MTREFADGPRWTPKRKAALLARIEAGEVDPAQLERLGLSQEELTTWRRDFSDHGLYGLQVYSLHYHYPNRRKAPKHRRDRPIADGISPAALFGRAASASDRAV
jgi:hypothetical protein